MSGSSAKTRGGRQFDQHVRSARRGARDGDRASQAFDDIPGDREAKACAGSAGRKERIEDAREVLGNDADAPVLDGDCDAPVGSICASRPARRQAVRLRAGVDGMLGVGQDVHERDPKPLGVGHDRRQIGGEIEPHCHPPPSGRAALRGVGAQRVDIDRSLVEPDRPGEVEYLGRQCD